MAKQNGPTVIPHRVNTVEKLQEMAAAGFTIVECDVCVLTGKGFTSLVVAHPTDMLKTGFVADPDITGYFMHQDDDHTVVYLNDFVEEANRLHLTLLIEIKPMHAGLPKGQHAELIKNALFGSHSIASFDRELLYELRKRSKDVQLALFTADSPSTSDINRWICGLQPWAVFGDHWRTRASIIDNARARCNGGWFVINDFKTVRELASVVMNWCLYFISDSPIQLQKALEVFLNSDEDVVEDHHSGRGGGG